jgi:hypothetical protein
MININSSIPTVGIYKITSPSGKVYIGQSINISERKTYYYGLHCKRQPKLYKSLKKYSFEKHQFDILEECDIKQLDDKEVYWKIHYINLLGWKEVLFCEIYDKGGGPRSETTKSKISESNKGKSRPKTKEWAAKLGGKGTPRIALQQSIIQCDLNGNVIKNWNSASDAELFFTGDKDKDNIRACVRGKQKTAYGYRWMSI